MKKINYRNKIAICWLGLLVLMIGLVGCNQSPQSLSQQDSTKEKGDTDQSEKSATTDSESENIAQSDADSETIEPKSSESKPYPMIVSYYNQDQNYSFHLSKRYFIDRWAGRIRLVEQSTGQELPYLDSNTFVQIDNSRAIDAYTGFGTTTEDKLQQFTQQLQQEPVILPDMLTIDQLQSHHLVLTTQSLDTEFGYPLSYSQQETDQYQEAAPSFGKPQLSVLDDSLAAETLIDLSRQIPDRWLMTFVQDDLGFEFKLPFDWLTQDSIGGLLIETDRQANTGYLFRVIRQNRKSENQILVELLVVDKEKVQPQAVVLTETDQQAVVLNQSVDSAEQLKSSVFFSQNER